MKKNLIFCLTLMILAPSSYSDDQVASDNLPALPSSDQFTSIEPHRSNYFLPVSYSTNPNQSKFEYVQTYSEIDSVEVKFQISFKIDLTRNYDLGENGLYIAYTQTSWWQTYNGDASRPFRETNYLPEVFWQFSGWNREPLGFSNSYNRLGVAHISNGSTRPQSRTRNYLYFLTSLNHGPWKLEMMPRLKLPDIRDGEANPDLEDYIGHLDASLTFSSNNQQVYTFAIKGNPSYGHYGAQFDWSFPLYQDIHGLIQVYAGYAESLIDYDHENYRFSMGFTLAPPKL